MRIRMNQAISRAIADEMERDPRVVVFGEDVAVAEGPFKTSEGLLTTFGPDRVRDTPISETGFLGAAVGAAMTGLRPVAEIMFIEFLGVAFDQIVTEAALMHYLSGGRFNVPMVMRASAGSGLGFGCQHSQSLERWMLGTPGLKMAVPSGARTAYGLTRAAIRDNNPVVLLESRALYGERENVEPGDDAIIELGDRRDGTPGIGRHRGRPRPDRSRRPRGRDRGVVVRRGHRSAHPHAVGQRDRPVVSSPHWSAGHRRREPVHRRVGDRDCLLRLLRSLWRSEGPRGARDLA